MEKLQQLIEISRHYGSDPGYVIAGGGNTSYKDERHIWIKASGIPLAGIRESGLVCLSREKLREIEGNVYSTDPVIREEQVKKDIHKAILSPENLRPSVETSLHNLIDYAYVVHTHPAVVNGLMCSIHVKEEVEARFGPEVLYIEYTDPGYVLFKKVQERIRVYREHFGKAPTIIFLQNHGVFAGADTIDEIRNIYQSINERISCGTNISLPECASEWYASGISSALKEYCTSRGLESRAVRCALVDHFSENQEQYRKIALPFSPDIIVYCKSNYLFVNKMSTADQARSAFEEFEKSHGYYPRVVIEEAGGLIVVEENVRSLEIVFQVFLDQMKISYLSENFGGPHFMSPEQIRFIDNWEVEHYRRKIAKNG